MSDGKVVPDIPDHFLFYFRITILVKQEKCVKHLERKKTPSTQKEKDK